MIGSLIVTIGGAYVLLKKPDAIPQGKETEKKTQTYHPKSETQPVPKKTPASASASEPAGNDLVRIRKIVLSFGIDSKSHSLLSFLLNKTKIRLQNQCENDINICDFSLARRLKAPRAYDGAIRETRGFVKFEHDGTRPRRERKDAIGEGRRRAGNRETQGNGADRSSAVTARGSNCEIKDGI